MFDPPISISRPPYALLVELFLAGREEANRAPATLRNYRMALARFAGSDAIPDDPSAITPDHLVLWLASLRRAGMPGASRAWHQRHVWPFLRWLYVRGNVDRDPLRGVPRVSVEQRILPQVVPQDMIRLLTVAADRPRTKQGNQVTVEHQYRNLALLRVLWSTGVRRRELLELSLADVEFADRTILVRGKGDKQRRVPFDAATKLALLEYMQRERGDTPGPLWQSRGGRVMSENALKLVLKRLAQRAGVDGVTPHAFRRGFARHVRRAGLDLGETAALLGHSTLVMTRRYSQQGEHDAALDAYRRLIG